jgi:hypothetical protein
MLDFMVNGHVLNMGKIINIKNMIYSDFVTQYSIFPVLQYSSTPTNFINGRPNRSNFPLLDLETSRCFE